MANSPGTALNKTETLPFTQRVKEAFPGKVLSVMRWRDAVEWEVETKAEQLRIVRISNDTLRSVDAMTELDLEIYRVKKEK